MDLSRLVLLILAFYLCEGASQSTVPDLISNDINPDGVVHREAGYGHVKFEGQLDQDDHPGYRGPQLYPGDDSSNNRPLKFEDDVKSYTIQNNHNPSSTAQNMVSFKDDTNHNTNRNKFNQIPGQKKRRKRRRRKSRRFNEITDIKFGPGGQPIIPFYDPTAPKPTLNNEIRDVKIGPEGQPNHSIPFHDQTAPRPSLNDMSGPLRVISDALNSIIENDSKLCVRRMLCEQAATNDQIQNSTLLQTAIRVFQYIPFLKRNAAINALPLASPVGLISLAMRYGAMARNVSACQSRYPQCPDDPEERIHYFNNHRGGIFRFFRGNDQHQYTAAEFHNQLLQLGLKPQPNPANAYGFYQPQYGQSGQQVAHPYPFYNGYQTPTAPGQYGLRQQNFPTNSQNSYGLYHNQIRNQLSNNNANYQSSSVYGPAYSHNRRFNSDGVDLKSNPKHIDESNKNIQRRIQNKPGVFSDDNYYADTKLTFPKFEAATVYNFKDLNNVRGGRQLKFPYEEKVQEIVKEAKGFSFPGAQSNRQSAEFPGDILADDDLRVDDTGYAVAGGIHPAVDDEEYEVVFKFENEHSKDKHWFKLLQNHNLNHSGATKEGLKHVIDTIYHPRVYERDGDSATSCRYDFLMIFWIR
ncbi:hypothetical protein O0L34_g3269 [Tuta absoluta]|nr:hypothetical protein O0L34_g3269 [Tuta absoluta]